MLRLVWNGIKTRLLLQFPLSSCNYNNLYRIYGSRRLQELHGSVPSDGVIDSNPSSKRSAQKLSKVGFVCSNLDFLRQILGVVPLEGGLLRCRSRSFWPYLQWWLVDYVGQSHTIIRRLPPPHFRRPRGEELWSGGLGDSVNPFSSEDNGRRTSLSVTILVKKKI